MARIRGGPDAAKLMEAGRDYELTLTETLVHATDVVQISRNQGAIKALRELRETFESAPETIRKLTPR